MTPVVRALFCTAQTATYNSFRNSGRNCHREVLRRPCVRSWDMRPEHDHPGRCYQGEVGSRRARLGPRDFDDIPCRGSTRYTSVFLTNTLRQNIYYRRTRRLDVPLITEVKLLPEGEAPESMSDAWHKVPKSARTGAASLAPLFLWYKAEKSAQEMTDAERKNDLITELDVIYGEGVPWYGFERLSPPTTPEIKNRRQSVYITFRRGVKRTCLGAAL